MMKILLLTILGCLCFTAADAGKPAKGAHLKMENPTYDFGDVPRKGGDLVREFRFVNDGTAPLDAEHIFERFYQGARKEGSTGLGLALVSAVGRYYGLRIDYRFEGGRHRFSVRWP